MYSFDRRCGNWKIDAVKAAIEGGLVALISRVGKRPDGAIRRIELKPMAGTMAKRSPTSTVVIPEGLVSTYTPRTSLAKGL